MSAYVLVHGAWHGPWCWKKIKPALENAGHKVIAVTLPCHGNDATPIRKASVARYANSVEEVILAQKEPVILVGHSLGGMTVTKVAEDIPASIEKLIYVAAYVPSNTSVFRLTLKGEKLILMTDYNYHFIKGTFDVKNRKKNDMFYQDCAKEDIAFARKRLTTEPLRPSMTYVKTTEENYGSVKKYYVKTTEDHTIPPKLQDYMISRVNFEKVFQMDTGHSPFFCRPEQLTDLLLSV